MKKQFLASAVVAALALGLAGAAQAQVAGQVLVKAGWNKIIPKVESGDLSAPTLPGSKIDIHSASALLLTGAYMITDSISVEFLGGLPYKHTIVGAGTVAGVGKIGSIHQISPTALLQYRFLTPTDLFRPYVGAGPTWAKFYKSEGSANLTAVTNPGGNPTIIGGDTSWGASVEAGLNYKIDQHWFLDAAALKTFISTKSRMSTGQEISTKLNPVSFNVSVGYTF
jgi:outer membrane protein